MEQQFDLPQLQTDPETFRRVWSRVMPDQENSPLVVVSQPQPAPAQSRAESAPGAPPPAPAPDRPRPPQTGAQACTEAPLCLGEEITRSSAAQEMGAGCVEKSRGLPGLFRDAARELGCPFLDANALDLAYNTIDFMHLTRESHARLAEALAGQIPTLL